MSEEVLKLARDHFITGNYSAAEPILQQLLLRDSSNPEVYQMLATIAYDKGQFNKAIKTFRKALEIDPTYTDASVGLSIILNDLGRYDEGKEVFAEAQGHLNTRNKENDSFLNDKLAELHQKLADLYFQHQRFDESLEQLFKIQRLLPENKNTTLKIVDCFVQLDQPYRALKELKALVRENPEFLEARVKLGVIYYNNGDYREAQTNWNQVLIRDPQHPEVLKYLKALKSQVSRQELYF